MSLSRCSVGLIPLSLAMLLMFHSIQFVEAASSSSHDEHQSKSSSTTPRTPSRIDDNVTLTVSEGDLDRTSLRRDIARSSLAIPYPEALRDLYYATNGDRWYDKNGWLSDTCYCQWLGLSCGSFTCNQTSCENCTLIRLDLQRNNLVGKGREGKGREEKERKERKKKADYFLNFSR
jgi:hypothetical protein